MNINTDLVCCPQCRGNLDTVIADSPANTLQLRCGGCMTDFSASDGYIDFLGEKGLVHSSTREKTVRNLYAKIYTPATNAMFLLCGGAAAARSEVMDHLRIRNGDTVLETGTGPGENFLWMSKRNSGLSFHGIDIQKIMVENCIKNLKKWGLEASIARADAESLPYRDAVFDVVFHLGAINLFGDRRKAISEMIRVARSGTHIVLADETEKAGRLFNLITGSKERITPPVEFIPGEMRNVSLSIIWRGYGWLIEFDKP